MEIQFSPSFDNYTIKATKHEIYLQKVCKFTLSAFDEKRKILNEIGSIPWN